MGFGSRAQDLLVTLSEKNPHRGTTVPDVPKIPINCVNQRAPTAFQLAAVQRVLCKLQYNFLPSTFFSLAKKRSLARIIGTAKEILNESLPIRCLEATFVAIYLTQHLLQADRFPLSFKSVCRGRAHRHIVLVFRCGEAYGALGLSRRADLMDKPIVFPTLRELLEDYRACYRHNGHTLVSIKLGLLVSHNTESSLIPCWRYLSMPMPNCPIDESSHEGVVLRRFTEDLRVLSAQYEEVAAIPWVGSDICDVAAPPRSRRDVNDSDLDIGDDDEDAAKAAGSDSEENQNRIRCLLSQKTPWDRIAAACERRNNKKQENNNKKQENNNKQEKEIGQSKVAARLRRRVAFGRSAPEL